MRKHLPIMAVAAIATSVLIAPAAQAEPDPGMTSPAPTRILIEDKKRDVTSGPDGNTDTSVDLRRVTYASTYVEEDEFFPGSSGQALVITAKYKAAKRGQSSATFITVDGRDYLVTQRGHTVTVQRKNSEDPLYTKVKMPWYHSKVGSPGEKGILRATVPVTVFADDEGVTPQHLDSLRTTVLSKNDSLDQAKRSGALALFPASTM